jgi:hypothetical protein
MLACQMPPKRRQPPVKVYPCGREVCRNTPAGKSEYRNRTLFMRATQNNLCSWCGLFMSQEDCTFDHSEGRGMNGSHRDDRVEGNTAMHSKCNVIKASVRLSKLKAA